MIGYTWDESKRQRNLRKHGLDFADAEAVFSGEHFTRTDDRQDYGEERKVTAGYLKGRIVVLAWAPREGERRIISMRYGNAREEEKARRHIARH